MTFYIFALMINELPMLAFWAWIGLIVFESIKADKRIVALQSKYDPQHHFIRRRIGSINSYWLDRTHPKCSSEFLKEWDLVYGVYWWRIVLLSIGMPFFGFGAQYLRTALQQIFQI